MQHVRLFLSLLLVAGMLVTARGRCRLTTPKPKGVKPGVTVVAVLNKAGTYCHLKFPAISRSTLSSAKPELSTKAGEIDFYGRCDHDLWVTMKSASRESTTRSGTGAIAISKSLQIHQEGDGASAFPSWLKQQRAPHAQKGCSERVKRFYR